jgi:D-alanine transaminase
MTEWIWLNGEKLPMSEARISVEDRGFQFADGIYEVIRLYDGKPFALDLHLARLERSAAGIELSLPLSRAALSREIGRFIHGISAGEGMIYLQVTRGSGPRNHLFPHLSGQGKIEPTILFYFRTLPVLPPPGQAPGAKLISTPDERWQRCWIKSIALLPNVLSKSAAVAAGADEAVFIDRGIVTECSASNLFGVVRGQLVTHPVGPKVLPGITRAIILELAGELGIAAKERPWTEAEALAADELFILSTTREVSWVQQWNEKAIAPGRCGPVTMKLHTALREYVAEKTAPQAGPLITAGV